MPSPSLPETPAETPSRRESVQRRLEARLVAFEAWSTSRRTLFWTLHSLWALATGVVVVALAHEQYAFVPWVFAMLAVTWVSTLFFVRFGQRAPSSSLGRLGSGVLSYLMRVMYQETLFFLLPFYAYSTALWPVPAWSLLFLVLLGALAVVSCLDLVFDRLLRDSPLFALVFFATVAFAALNLLLPLVFRLRVDLATSLAAWLALGSALPLAFRERAASLRRVAGPAGLALALAVLTPQVAWVAVPPVPLRLTRVDFAGEIQRDPLEARDILGRSVSTSDLAAGRLGVVARIFSPTRLAAEVVLHWEHDGSPVRQSRSVEIVPHRSGFRVWDALTFDGAPVPEGRYRVSVRADGRLLGSAEIEVTPARPAQPASL
jgi:hypothetical protein